jgi:predicted O-methyltransferase YrrM
MWDRKSFKDRLRSLFSADKADEILKEMEIDASARGLPIVGRCRGQVLINIIRKIKPKRILEIGTFMGYSTILMGRELENDAKIITIEFNEDLARIAQENIKKAEIRPTVEIVVDDALNAIPRLDGEFDLVFLDGAKRQYTDYLISVESKLHKGSVVVADNVGVFANVIKKYLEYVRSSGRFDSRYIPADEEGVVTVVDEDGVFTGVDGVEVSTKL